MLRLALVVQVFLKVAVDSRLAVVVEAVLRLVVAVAKVVPLAAGCEVKAKRILKGTEVNPGSSKEMRPETYIGRVRASVRLPNKL